MYKVFFNDRAVLLTDDFIKHFQLKYGLFYKFRDKEDLQELIDFYRKLKRINSLFIFHHDIEQLRIVFKSCFYTIQAAGGLVRNEKGQVLIIKRRGKWDLPKGKLNDGEASEHAALREVEEECGLKGLQITEQLLSTYHAYDMDDKHVLKKTYWYAMSYNGKAKPVPQLNEDITEIIWYDPEDLPAITGNTYLTVLDILRYSKLLEL